MPLQGMVFDYYVDDATCSMVPWEGKVPSFSYMPDSFASLFVPTVDTTRLTYFLDTLIAKKHYVMFVGNTGKPMLDMFQANSALVVLAQENLKNVAWRYSLSSLSLHALYCACMHCLHLALPFRHRIKRGSGKLLMITSPAVC